MLSVLVSSTHSGCAVMGFFHVSVGYFLSFFVLLALMLRRLCRGGGTTARIAILLVILFFGFFGFVV
jgi:hypothetical protein